MSIKRSQLQELVEHVVRTIMELDSSLDPGIGSTTTDSSVTALANPTDPLKQQKAKRDQKRETQKSIVKLQKQEKFRDKQEKSRDKMWRIQKRDLDKQINGMKSGLNQTI